MSTTAKIKRLETKILRLEGRLVGKDEQIAKLKQRNKIAERTIEELEEQLIRIHRLYSEIYA